MNQLSSHRSIPESLQKSSGWWRTPDELMNSPEFEEYVANEFPTQASLDPGSMERRTFLKLMAASFAMAGLTACNNEPQPIEKILPYVRQPEGIVAGNPVFYATALECRGLGVPVLVKTIEGRPVKIEGNTDHPASRGASSAQAQAEILRLYDPDRLRAPQQGDEIVAMETARARLVQMADAAAENGGAGHVLLTGPVTSPTLARQISQWKTRFRKALWVQWDSENRDEQRTAMMEAFGRDAEPHFRFDKAKAIVGFSPDFMHDGANAVRYQTDFSDATRVRSAKKEMLLFMAAECTPTVTGAMAEDRLPASTTTQLALAEALLEKLRGGASSSASFTAEESQWLDRAAKTLHENSGEALVVAGRIAPAAIHRCIAAINETLGGVGKTISYREPVAHEPTSSMESLAELHQRLTDGYVASIVILDSNVVYTAPADLQMGVLIGKVAASISIGYQNDETARACQWRIPLLHELETWNDFRAGDGSAIIAQPTINPLHGGLARAEAVGLLCGDSRSSAREIVAATWRTKFGEAEFEAAWRTALQSGYIPEEEPAELSLSAAPLSPSTDTESDSEIEALILGDPNIGDGRFSNNAWLQEIPRPFTKIVWANPALISPSLAKRLSLTEGDVVELTVDNRSIEIPVYTMPGQAPNAVTLFTGYGRTGLGRAADGVGVDVAPLRTSAAFSNIRGVRLRKTGVREAIVVTQNHHLMEGRDLVRVAALDDLQLKQADDEHAEMLIDSAPPMPPAPNQWAMVIDLNVCNGCNACVAACQAENNIPVVGKDEVARGREMHWLRIDQYHRGSLDAPEFLQQPVPCMHCEKAPCEIVCPVGATTHSAEGLNEMTYNRCVGTRYCSNNCPYKVRRFNFFNYAKWEGAGREPLRNPEVTVRERGVMEKCSYCVQRINRARIDANARDLPLAAKDAQTACAQACPSRAIIFGDLSDAAGEIQKLRAEPHHYSLLAHLSARPRTTYLAKVGRTAEDANG